MRRASLALMLPAVTPAVASGPSPSPVEAEIRAAADAFDRAQFAKDGAALDRMIAPDLVYIRGAGKRVGKAAFIAGFTDPKTRFDPFRITDRVYVGLSPNSGMVGGEAVLSGSDADGRFSEHILYTDTFQRRGGRWQVVHVQVTMVRDGAK